MRGAVAFHGLATVQCRILGLTAFLLIIQGRAGGFLDALSLPIEFVRSPDHIAAGRLAVSPCAAGLLVILFKAAGSAVIDDPSHVGFVDAHAECGGGDDDFESPFKKRILNICLACLIHFGVEIFGLHPGGFQRFRQLLGSCARCAVDYAAFAAMCFGILRDACGAILLGVRFVSAEV